MPYPPDAEWLGIRFAPGVSVVPRLAKTLVDQKVILPPAARGSFWLNGSAWQAPDFGSADAFVEELVRNRVLVMDPAVAAALHGEVPDSSLRTLQRRFLQATGVTQTMTRQIEQARYAVLLLKEAFQSPGRPSRPAISISPHMTRSLRRFVGHIPAQLFEGERANQLSFLYKTKPFDKP